MAMLVAAPLSFLKRMDSLRFTRCEATAEWMCINPYSYIAIASVLYVLALIVYYFTTVDGHYLGRGVKYAVIPGATFFSNIPIFVFAYTCHQNVRLLQF